MSVNLNKMPPPFEDDVPLNFPDGSHIPVGLTLLLATQEHITLSEARRSMIEAWRADRATGRRGAKGRRTVGNRHQANGEIRKALEIIKNIVPKDTVVL